MSETSSLLFLFSCAASLWFSHTLVVFPSSVTENKGSNFTLYCRENNMVQAQSIQWRAPGGTVYDPADAASSAAAGARISAVTAYTLAVTGLQAGDGGAYRCERKNNLSDYAIGTVQVTVLPYIVNPVALQQIVLGQNATIRCQYNADASPTPTTYWYKGNRQINDSRLTVISGGLLIASVASTDEGNYTCVVLSGVGSASIVIMAVFRAPPRFVAVTASPSVLIQKGDSVILDCSAVGVPVPIYAWIAPPTVNPLSVSTGTLTVTAVDFSVTGNYNCTALNSVGTVTKSFYVFVFAPPYPSAYIHPPIAVQSDQPVVLNCQVIAMPQPTYSWLLYNSQNYQTYPIDHLNVVINGSMLSIPSIYSATAAYSIWFVCLASNAYGEGRHYFRLDISPSPLVSSLPSSLLSTPTTEVLSAALQSGLEAGGNTVLPVIVATVCAGLVALLSILCFTGLALYLSRNCRRKVNLEQQSSLEQSVRSTLSSTSEQSTLFLRQPLPLYSRLMLSSTSSQTSAPFGLGSFPSVDDEEDDGVFVETINPAFQEMNPALQNPHQDMRMGHQEVHLGHPEVHLGHQEVNMSFQQTNPTLHASNPLYEEGVTQPQEADSLQDSNPAYFHVTPTRPEEGRAQEVMHNSAALEVPVIPVYAEVLSKDTPSNAQSIYETIH